MLRVGRRGRGLVHLVVPAARSAATQAAAPSAIHAYDCGTVPYMTAWDWQTTLFQQRASAEVQAAPLGEQPEDVMLLLQHPAVFTLGRKKGGYENVMFDLQNHGFEVHRVERGGQVTYHGPGQLVAYPILNLNRHTRDLRWYVTAVEEMCIKVAAGFGVSAGRDDRNPGVWVGDDKLAAIGISSSRWVTMHGLAFNVSPDMEAFRHITACGLQDAGVTSLAAQLGADRCPTVPEVAAALCKAAAEVFGREVVRHAGPPPAVADHAQAESSPRFTKLDSRDDGVVRQYGFAER